jgi:hypothetical protein
LSNFHEKRAADSGQIAIIQVLKIVTEVSLSYLFLAPGL